jgi:hypothetical protein
MARIAFQLRFLPIGCLAAAISALAFSTTPANAQTSAMPTPTQAPSGSVPSMPAATPAQTTPAPAYHDPLEQPIVVPPAQQSAPVTMPLPATVASLPSAPAYDFPIQDDRPDHLGSTYIPVDSIIYPMAMRLYSLGYLNTVFINMRPWTRRSLLHALQETSDDVNYAGDDQAQEIVAKLTEYLSAEDPGNRFTRGRVFGVESFYTRLMGITGTPLRDSYHLGQTIVNDYGRPYANGFNNITGFSSVNEVGRFSLYVRGEYQHSGPGDSYSPALANTLSCTVDQICPFVLQDTIPYGSVVNAQNPFRLQEAAVSFHLLGHEISGGKSDAWMGPGAGGGMAWSDNAEDIYSFRINRVEPMHIPYLSAILGPLRYDFFVGSLKGHTQPNEPWMHSEMFSFAPTSNFQFGFERTVIWGGHGHGCLAADGSVIACNEPITLHTFLKSFFSLDDETPTQKYSRDDAGARFSVFNFSWRLPFLRHYVTLYTDSIAHDDVTPPSAPRRAAYRPGLFLSQFPHFNRFDLRVEAASTDTSTLRSQGGQFNYFETIQRQGYTNKGFIMGDWIGREAKGGQAWLTYHLSGDEWVQIEYLNKKTPKDFVPLGTTQNQFKVDVVKHLPYGIMMDAWLQVERWKAPVYLQGQQNDTVIAAQFTWFPKLHTEPVSR